ncbi:MAG: thioredoxin family protein [Gammaproteobacteria bacterium]|nr:thioredoxin family protein [Gammaproteobacteria bacterium]
MANDHDSEVIDSAAALQAFIHAHAAAAIYFAGANCGVCQVLEPKLRALLRESFPRLAFARIATEQAVELAAQQGVFAVPTLLLFFDGRETLRYTRNFSIGEVGRDIARPYALLFE